MRSQAAPDAPRAGPAAPPHDRPLPSQLRTHRIELDGRSVSFAEGGDGLPVLFLHGWGLGHPAYHRALSGLVARGCRVLAPSLPGFGGTADVPGRDRSLRRYAAWVARFVEAVGEDRPLVVLGHSFGGGVATRLAHDFPDRVRYLVLLNSVGDPTSFSLSGARTTLARAGAQPRFATRWRPTPGRLAAATAAGEVFVRNLVTNPSAMVEVAGVAMSADLRGEMAVLAQRRLPVLVLWSDRDGLIPLTAFDTFCSAFGTDGHVVSGGHSWLLSDPDVFGEVLDNVIQVQRWQDGTEAASASAEEVRRLLEGTTMDAGTVTDLVGGVSPMWLLSESPSVLAADLALCHPTLADGEVRAVARPLPDGGYRLTVVAADRRGLLADTAGTLAAEGFSIGAASVTTWPERDLALHAMTLEAGEPVHEARWRAIGDRLAGVGHGVVPAPPFRPAGPAVVTLDGEAAGGSLVRVTAPDGPGLLSAVCRWFADQGLSIDAAHVSTTDGTAEDVFLVGGWCDADALATHLGPTTAAPSSLATWPLALAGRLPCWRHRRPTAG